MTRLRAALRPHRPHPGQVAWPLGTAVLTGLAAALMLIAAPDAWYLLAVAATWAYGCAACLVMPFYLPERATPDRYATPPPALPAAELPPRLAPQGDLETVRQAAVARWLAGPDGKGHRP